MKRNPNGEVVLASPDLLNLILDGQPIPTEFIADPHLYDELVHRHGGRGGFADRHGAALRREAPPELPLAEFDRRNQSCWRMPAEYRGLSEDDLLRRLADADRRSDDRGIRRITEEFQAFRERGLLDLLRFLCHFTDRCRAEGIVTGVGRGSSVSSYILYLIGISKVDPLEYGLDFRDFLK